jgi:hypothetical protein
MPNQDSADDTRSRITPTASRRNVLRGVAGTVGGLTVGTALESGVARAANWDQLTDVAVYVDGHTYDDFGYEPAWTLQTLLQDSFEYNEIQAHSVTVMRDGGGYDLREYTKDPSNRPDYYGDKDDGDGDDESDSDFFGDYEDADEDGVYERGSAGRLGELSTKQIIDDFKQYLEVNDLFSNHEDHHLIYHHEDKLKGRGGGRISVGHGDQLANLDGGPYDPDRYSVHTRGGSVTPGDAAFVSMQEVGHMLGLCDGSDHNCGMHYDEADVEYDEVHDTTTYDLAGDGDDVYSTPMGAAKGGYNQCDQWADDPTESGYDVEYTDARWWYRCAGNQLRNDIPRVHTLTIESSGDYVEYDFSVSRSVIDKSTKCNATINSGDSISGNSASGQVNNGGRDTYLFSGDVTSFSASKPTYEYDVYVKCQEVIEESLGNNVVTIDGGSDGNSESYDLTASRGLRKSTANGASIQNGDQIYVTNGGKNQRVTGRVYDGVDSFRYWGGILRENYDTGGATVTYSSV